MRIVNKNILIISPEPWDHIFVSKHHYAIALAKRGNHVCFLNPPSNSAGIVTITTHGVVVMDHMGYIAGTSKMPRLIRLMFFKRAFKKIEQAFGSSFDIVWSFDNSVFYDFNFLPKRILKIFHLVDLDMNFNLASATKTANFCICTTEIIKKEILLFNNNAYKITHGYAQPEKIKPWNLPGKNTLKAVYVGNLSMLYLDWKILYQTAASNNNVDFIFYGPNAENFDQNINSTHGFKKEISQIAHVYFEGKVASSDISSVLESADILLVSYQEIFHHEQANPHKMIEYLGSGKPIVATYTSEYLDQKHLLYMSEKNEDWPEKFRYVVDHMEEAKSPMLETQRKAYATDNTIEKQLHRIEKLIDQ